MSFASRLAQVPATASTQSPVPQHQLIEPKKSTPVVSVVFDVLAPMRELAAKNTTLGKEQTGSKRGQHQMGLTTSPMIAKKVAHEEAPSLGDAKPTNNLSDYLGGASSKRATVAPHSGKGFGKTARAKPTSQIARARKFAPSGTLSDSTQRFNKGSSLKRPAPAAVNKLSKKVKGTTDQKGNEENLTLSVNKLVSRAQSNRSKLSTSTSRIPMMGLRAPRVAVRGAKHRLAM